MRIEPTKIYLNDGSKEPDKAKKGIKVYSRLSKKIHNILGHSMKVQTGDNQIYTVSKKKL